MTHATRNSLLYVLGIGLVAACGGGAKEKAATKAVPAAAASKQDGAAPGLSDAPTLLGHWKLDETEGTVAADSSPTGKHDASIVGKATWTAGKLAGGLRLGGDGSHVEIPHAEELGKVSLGSYSLAAWFKPASRPSKQKGEGKDKYGILLRQGWHEGLCFSEEGTFQMAHWLAAEEPEFTGAENSNTFQADEWQHVVGVVDTDARQVRLYVNGKLAASGTQWPEGKEARDLGETPWRIGLGAKEPAAVAWPADGTVDDVRIYRGVLDEAAVMELYRQGA